MKRQSFTLVLTAYCVVVMLTLVSCKKETQTQIPTPTVPPPEMEYTDLGNTIIKAGAPAFFIDVNHDGRNDLVFSTLLVGDPLNQIDKLQFLISSNIQICLPVNPNEQIHVMNIGDSIVSGNFNGYHWFDLSSIVLTQKIISFTAPPVWEGHWKDAVHRYLPYQVISNAGPYNGWVELTVDTAGEKIILHKAAISKEAGRSIKVVN